MTPSTLRSIACVFVVCLSVYAQNPPKKILPGSISGKVTLKGNGAPGILVGARPMQSGRQVPLVVVTTDQQGNYRMSNVPPGEYEVVPAAPQYVLPTHRSIQRLIVSEGGNLEGVDFVLIRGGVITGKVTDEDGRPIVNEYIEVRGPEGQNSELMTHLAVIHPPTDDRGVYRIYGLAPGKYRVAAGTSEERMYFAGRSPNVYLQTFHPSTTEVANATVIEVTEGGEATNVDIVLRRTQSVYTATGRVVDGDTGQPIADVIYGLEKYRENGSSGSSGFATNKLGEFRIENLTPGKYALYLEQSGSRPIYAEPLKFEVVDHHVKDLVLKTSSGSSLSGVVVFEGMEEKARLKLKELMIFAFVQNADSASVGGGNAPSAMVKADNSFTLSGLRPGVVSRFGIWPRDGSPLSQLEVVRMERDGVVQSKIEIKPREQIKGLRLIVKSSSGSIRGVVKFEHGTQTSATVQVFIKSVGDDNNSRRSAELDDRGRFIVRGLTAGVYEVTVVGYPARFSGRPPSTKQQVVVNEDQVSDVTLTLDLKTDTGEGRP
jgi:protocatechuate 3,4-dioxygenase beta subunit